MKKIFLLLIFNFLFALEYSSSYYIAVDGRYFYCSNPVSVSTSLYNYFLVDYKYFYFANDSDGEWHQANLKYTCELLGTYNPTCLSNNINISSYNIKVSYSSITPNYYNHTGYISLSPITLPFTFCQDKDGYTYNSDTNTWVSTSDGSVICNPQTFNIDNKCNSICPAGNIYFNYNGQNYCVAPNVSDLSKILGDEVNQCTIGTYSDGTFKIITENGKDYIGLNCGNSLYLLPYTTQDLQVGEDNNISSPTENTITCYADQYVSIDENGSVYCVASDNNTSQSDTNTSESTGSTGSTVSDTNTSESTGSTGSTVSDTNTSLLSESSSLDCCYYYNNPQTGDEWTQSDGKWCSEKYKCCIYFDSQGQCQVSGSDLNSTSSANSFVDLNETNKILNNINNSINDNLKEVNKSFSNFNKLLDSVKSGNVSVFENLKGEVSINPNTYQPFSANSNNSFPTISLDLFGKHIILIDDSYRKYIPFDIIKPIVIFVFVFSAFLICMKTD